MKNYVLFILLFGFLTACNSDSSKLDKLSWLEGKWQAKVQGNDVIETWSKDNDTSWTGESAFIKDGKTLFTEIMSIRVTDGKMQFISAVSDQNDAESVIFEEIQWENNKIVFENKAHDFPQRVTYKLKQENKMLAFISGEFGGKSQRIDFNFTKVK